ncbi:DUF3489 domain-containing protein [Novosphingobium aquiterrae]|uniref:DUF3489 domain-containing protein n=1 Tax=Novosphingobium aquiterrae TaxID=624388 RepID=A0ABV6PIK1_9SPHN
MTKTTTKPRRMARERDVAGMPASPEKKPSKLDHVERLLLVPSGTTIADIVAATGWQQHSVRGALAGALRKRGLKITSDKVGGVRRYRASKPA